MLKRKTTFNLSILRLIAAAAIVSFSFEITSSLVVSEDTQIEIVDMDFDDDTEVDDEKESIDLTLSIEPSEFDLTEVQRFHTALIHLPNQHLEELPSPPPDCA